MSRLSGDESSGAHGAERQVRQKLALLLCGLLSIAALALLLVYGMPEKRSAHGLAASKVAASPWYQLRTITHEVAQLVQRDDLAHARARVPELEQSWAVVNYGNYPEAERMSRQRIDDAVQKAAATLKAPNSSQAECKAAMVVLIDALEAGEEAR